MEILSLKQSSQLTLHPGKQVTGGSPGQNGGCHRGAWWRSSSGLQGGLFAASLDFLTGGLQVHKYLIDLINFHLPRKQWLLSQHHPPRCNPPTTCPQISCSSTQRNCSGVEDHGVMPTTVRPSVRLSNSLASCSGSSFSCRSFTECSSWREHQGLHLLNKKDCFTVSIRLLRSSMQVHADLYTVVCPCSPYNRSSDGDDVGVLGCENEGDFPPGA